MTLQNMGVLRSISQYHRRWLGSSSSLRRMPNEFKSSEIDSKHTLVPCCDMVPIVELQKPRFKEFPNGEPSVLILGAGIAGLSAAERLIASGITNITILEANPEAGGRIKSCKMDSTIIEVGADEIEGASLGNSLYNMANAEGLVIRKVKRNQPVYLNEDGKVIISMDQPEMFTKNILQEVSSHFGKKERSPHHTVADYLEPRCSKALKNLPEICKMHFDRVISGKLNALRKKYGTGLCSLSLEEYGSAIDIPGGSWTIPNGISAVITPMMKKIESCSFKFNKVVQKLQYSVNSLGPRVTAICCDGCQYHGDYAIVTFSLGVLKSQAESLFQPSLPHAKMESIRKLGFGQLTKIFLQYKKPFWWKNSGASFRIGFTDSKNVDRAWIKGVCSVEEVTGPNHILKVTVSGREAEWVEQTDLDSAAEDFTYFMRKITGDNGLPHPIAAFRTCWFSDVFFLGARSFLGVGSSVADQCTLAAPIPGRCSEGPPVVLFAGEATCPGYFSTLHGARMSGQREADRIIELTEALRGAPECRVVDEYMEPCTPCPSKKIEIPPLVCPEKKRNECI